MGEVSLSSKNKQAFSLELDASSLSEKQLRLIEMMNLLSLQVAHSNSERELFESSYEMLEAWEAFIKNSNFFSGKDERKQKKSRQVLEYCLDEMSSKISEREENQLENN